MLASAAQCIALTCYGNALARGVDVPAFSPGHSTCKYTKSVKFASSEGQFPTPDAWLSWLVSKELTSIRLYTVEQQDAANDRMSAGMVGGGRRWIMETVFADGTGKCWEPQVEFDESADVDTAWKVFYMQAGGANTAAPYEAAPLSEYADSLRQVLSEIQQFSIAQNIPDYADVFGQASAALDDPATPLLYYEDMIPRHAMTDQAICLLTASANAWVFGGMGSWNDMSFEGEAQAEYERLSDLLFTLICDCLSVAATVGGKAA